MRIVNVRDFEGLYVVTDEGKVYATQTGKEVKGVVNKSGYLQVNLHKNGVRTTARVHQIVYYSFHRNRNKSDNLVIDHIDCDKTNNALSNLRKITTRQNTARAKTNRYGRGVSYYPTTGKYGANIQFGQTRYFLGVYETSEQASQAYSNALAKHKETGELPYKRDWSQKRCGMCGQMLPVEAFYTRMNNTHSYYCRECSVKYARDKRMFNKLNK